MQPLFRLYEPDQQLLLQPSLRDWLPNDHLVYFVSDAIDQLDLEPIVAWYRDRPQGNLPYHPAMMLKVLVYCYCTQRGRTGGFTMSRRSSRKRQTAKLGGGEGCGKAHPAPSDS